MPCLVHYSCSCRDMMVQYVPLPKVDAALLGSPFSDLPAARPLWLMLCCVPHCSWVLGLEADEWRLQANAMASWFPSGSLLHARSLVQLAEKLPCWTAWSRLPSPSCPSVWQASLERAAVRLQLFMPAVSTFWQASISCWPSGNDHRTYEAPPTSLAAVSQLSPAGGAGRPLYGTGA